MTAAEAIHWLLSRTVDPLVEPEARIPNDERVGMIEQLIVKQLAVQYFQAVERFTKTRILITSGASGRHNPGSQHYRGEALDFTLLRPDKGWAEVTGSLALPVGDILGLLAQDHGFSFLNEYETPTPATSGGHFHVAWRPNPRRRDSAS